MLAFDTGLYLGPCLLCIYRLVTLPHCMVWVGGIFMFGQQHRLEQVATRFPVVNATSSVSFFLCRNILNSSS